MQINKIASDMGYRFILMLITSLLSCSLGSSTEKCDTRTAEEIDRVIGGIFKISTFSIKSKICETGRDTLLIYMMSEKRAEYLSHPELQAFISSYILYKSRESVKGFKSVNFYLDKEKGEHASKITYDGLNLQKPREMFGNNAKLVEAVEFFIKEGTDAEVYVYNQALSSLNQSNFADQVSDENFIDLMTLFFTENITEDSLLANSIRGIFFTLLAKPEDFMVELSHINHIYNLRFNQDLYERNNVIHLKHN